MEYDIVCDRCRRRGVLKDGEFVEIVQYLKSPRDLQEYPTGYCPDCYTDHVTDCVWEEWPIDEYDDLVLNLLKMSPKQRYLAWMHPAEYPEGKVFAFLSTASPDRRLGQTSLTEFCGCPTQVRYHKFVISDKDNHLHFYNRIMVETGLPELNGTDDDPPIEDHHLPVFAQIQREFDREYGL